MKRAFPLASLLLMVLAAAGAAQGQSSSSRQSPSTVRPKTASSRCVDGTYSTSRSISQACKDHGGVAQWFLLPEADVTPSAALLGTVGTAPAPAPAVKPAPRAAVNPTPAAPSRPAAKPAAPKPTVKPAASPPPAGATARCADGTYSTARKRSDACLKNGGVARWY